MTASDIQPMPALVGYMGYPASQPRANLNLPANVEYTVAAMKPEDATSFAPRTITIADHVPFLDGVQATHVNQAGACGKLLARFGDAGEEVAIQMTGPLGGIGLLRGADGSTTAVRISATLSIQVDIQKADQTYLDNWATINLTINPGGSTSAELIFSQAPDTPIGVATISNASIDGGVNGLGLYFWTGQSLPFNGGYLEGRLIWSGDLNLAGEAYLEQGSSGSDDVQYVKVAARGTLTMSAAHKALLDGIRTTLRASAPLSFGGISVINPNALWRQIKDTPMSVAELVGMPLPDAQQYHTAVQTALVACALNAAPQDWLNTLKLNRQSIPKQVQSIASDPGNQDFFKTYLTAMGCSEVAAPSLSKYWKVPGGYPTAYKRMKFYWQGNAQNTLCNDKDFLRVNQAIAVTMFSSVVPAFQRYMNLNAADRLSWAQQLLAAITTPDELRSICATSDARDVTIHKYVTMLTALAPKSGLRKKFEDAVNAQLAKEVSLRLGAVGKQSAEEFILSVLQQLADPNSQDSSALFRELRAQLAQLKVSNPAAWVDLTGTLSAQAAALASIAAANRSWTSQMDRWTYVVTQKTEDELTRRIKIGFGAVALSALNLGLTAFSLVGAIKNWSDLRLDQKVASVASAVGSLASIFDASASLRAYIRTLRLTMNDGMLISDGLSVSRMPNLNVDSVAQRVAGEGTDAVVSCSIGAFSEPVNAIITIVGIINIVALGFQIADDAEDDQPVAVIVLDAITEVTLLVSTAITPFLAACPAAGVIVALAGIAEAIASAFIHRNPPPIGEWTENTASPFVNKIPDPSQDWLNKNHIVVPSAVAALNAQMLLALPPVAAGKDNLVAQIIWDAISGMRSLPDLCSDVKALVPNAPGVGPVFFRTAGNGTVVNGTDHTNTITALAAWTMGYLISSNQYFNVVNQSTVVNALNGLFTGTQGIRLSEDVFLERLYKDLSVGAIATYAKKAAGIEVVETILSPGWITLSYLQEKDHILPLQILMLLASNWGMDLTTVKQRYRDSNVPDIVFDFADHQYNFFSTLPAAGEYLASITASQELQHGSPGSNCGVDACNLCSNSCFYAGGPYNWSYVRCHYGEDVWNWVNANSTLVPVMGQRPYQQVRVSIGPERAPPFGTVYPPPCPCPC
jgi:hypothetical protein